MVHRRGPRKRSRLRILQPAGPRTKRTALWLRRRKLLGFRTVPPSGNGCSKSSKIGRSWPTPSLRCSPSCRKHRKRKRPPRPFRRRRRRRLRKRPIPPIRKRHPRPCRTRPGRRRTPSKRPRRLRKTLRKRPQHLRRPLLWKRLRKRRTPCRNRPLLRIWTQGRKPYRPKK